MKRAAITKRWLRFAPATTTMPIQIAKKTRLVPRSGWMKTSPATGATMTSEMSNVRRSRASPPCSLKNRARARIVASLANSEGWSCTGPRSNQRVEPYAVWPIARIAMSDRMPRP